MYALFSAWHSLVKGVGLFKNNYYIETKYSLLYYYDASSYMPRNPSGSNDPRPADAPQRVQRLIAAAGLCSRREAEKLIEQGRVTVNEEVVTLGASARSVDRIAVNGVHIEFPRQEYYILNKPADVVTAMRDKNVQTVIELIPSNERIYPVGRLDKDTTGLIFLTNDGAFAERVAHPRYEIEKTYVATLDRIFERKDIVKLTKGIVFKEGIANAKVFVVSPRRVALTIHQGYNHIVKRMFGALGYRVKELTRTRIGPIKLNLPEGAYRRLTDDEVAAVLAATKRVVRRQYVSRDQVEAARRERQKMNEKRVEKKTTWEPRRPSKGGVYPERERVKRVSRDERAADRDARRAKTSAHPYAASKRVNEGRPRSAQDTSSSSPSRRRAMASNKPYLD